MTPPRCRGESGVTLIEMVIASLLLSIVFVSVDTSIGVVQTHQVQLTNQTQGLDYLQIAEEAISKDIHAATDSWTTPALPTSIPSPATTSTSLTFTASLGGGTPTINVALNTSAHSLLVTCTGVGCSPTATSSTVITQARIYNVDSSTLFTLTTKEVSTTVNSVTTNGFYYTAVASSLVMDTPFVGAPHVFKTTLADPDIVANNAELACQNALSQTGASGSC